MAGRARSAISLTGGTSRGAGGRGFRLVKRGNTVWSFAAALCVAYLLVLQLVLSGVALGAHAAPDSQDHAGLVLCQGAAGGEGVPFAPTPPPHWPDCCQLVCQMGSVDLPVATGAAPLPPPAALETNAGLARDLTPAGPPARCAHPSRAPPLSA